MKGLPEQGPDAFEELERMPLAPPLDRRGDAGRGRAGGCGGSARFSAITLTSWSSGIGRCIR